MKTHEKMAQGVIPGSAVLGTKVTQWLRSEMVKSFDRLYLRTVKQAIQAVERSVNQEHALESVKLLLPKD